MTIHHICKKLQFFIPAFAIVCSIQATSKESAPDSNPKLTGELQAEFKDKGVPGLVVSVVTQTKPVYTQYFGSLDLQKPELRPNSSTLFHLASITKTLTAVGIMQLAEKNVVKLDDKVVEHLKWFNRFPGSEKISIRQLLSHTAGISRDAGLDFWTNPVLLRAQDPPSSTKYREALADQELIFEPGLRPKYSNMGFWILAELLAEKGGDASSQMSTEEKYENYIRSHILIPLGMTDSVFYIDKNLSPTEQNTASAYGLKLPNSKENKPLPFLSTTGGNIGSWGLMSSVTDMQKYVKWLLDESRGTATEVLKPDTFKQMIAIGDPSQIDPIDPANGHGLGFQLKNIDTQDPTFFHSGTYLGYRSVISVNPKSGYAVIVMSNAADVSYDKFANIAFGAYAPLKSPTPPKLTPAEGLPVTEDLKKLVGEYDYLAGRMQFLIKDEKLIAKQGGVELSLVDRTASGKPTKFKSITLQLGTNAPYSLWIGEKVVFELDSNNVPICGMVGNAYRLTPTTRPVPANSQLCPNNDL